MMPIRKVYNILADPTKAAWVIIFIAVALCFTLGWAIHLNSSVDSLKSNEQIAKKASHDTCVAGKPIITKLITGLETSYENSAKLGFKILRATDPKSMFYAPRKASWQNNRAVANVLKGLLPIRCT